MCSLYAQAEGCKSILNPPWPPNTPSAPAGIYLAAQPGVYTLVNLAPAG